MDDRREFMVAIDVDPKTGKLHEVRLWVRTVEPTDVFDLMHGGKPAVTVWTRDGRVCRLNVMRPIGSSLLDKIPLDPVERLFVERACPRAFWGRD